MCPAWYSWRPCGPPRRQRTSSSRGPRPAASCSASSSTVIRTLIVLLAGSGRAGVGGGRQGDHQDRHLGPGDAPELAHDLVHVAFDGAGRDRQPFGDLPVAQALGDEGSDLVLAPAERAQRARASLGAARRGPIGPLRPLAEGVGDGLVLGEAVAVLEGSVEYALGQ